VVHTAPHPALRRWLLPPLLAPEEREVLQAYAAGLSSDEIADRLGTDLGAIHEALQGAMRNLGASTRLEAILVAFSRGLLELPR
jgi:DNA-binding NarL/FixJ family response regulator